MTYKKKLFNDYLSSISSFVYSEKNYSHSLINYKSNVYERCLFTKYEATARRWLA